MVGWWIGILRRDPFCHPNIRHEEALMSITSDELSVKHEVAAGQVWDSGSGQIGFFVITSIEEKSINGIRWTKVNGEVINDLGRTLPKSLGKNAMISVFPDLYLDDVRTDHVWGGVYSHIITQPADKF